MVPFRQVYLLVTLLPLLSLAAIAQVTEATLKLSAVDEQSGSVSGASIEITNEETGMKRIAITDNNGQATIAGLPSGGYAVLLKASGFKTFSRKNLKLNWLNSRNRARWKCCCNAAISRI
jgi:Carboxypeptidase regulatory-like domain